MLLMEWRNFCGFVNIFVVVFGRSTVGSFFCIKCISFLLVASNQYHSSCWFNFKECTRSRVKILTLLLCYPFLGLLRKWTFATQISQSIKKERRKDEGKKITDKVQTRALKHVSLKQTTDTLSDLWCVSVFFSSFRYGVKYHRKKSRNEYLSLFFEFNISRSSQRESEIMSMTLASIIDEDDVGRWCAAAAVNVLLPVGTRHTSTTEMNERERKNNHSAVCSLFN